MPYRSHSRPMRFAVPVIAGAAAIAAVAGMPAAQAKPTPGWRVIRTFSAKNTGLDSLATLKGGTAWAGGETPAGLPVVYHITSKWRGYVLPGTIGDFVNSISATSPTNVWATHANTPAVAHLTAKGWVEHTFAIGTDQILLSGVVTTSPKDTFVFAYDFATKLAYAYHYDGKHWSQKLIPADADGNSSSGLVSGTSYSNIWALISIGGTTPASMRFNGKKWQVLKFPGHLAPAKTTVFGRQIYAESPTSVWATIYTLVGPRVGPVVLLHWNGHKWSKVGGRLPKAALTGPITSDGSGGLWLAAANTTFTKKLLLHYSRGKWSTIDAPTDLGKVLTIDQLSLVPGTHSVLGTAIIGLGLGTAGSAVLKYGP
jgi:hypothetical protein